MHNARADVERGTRTRRSVRQDVVQRQVRRRAAATQRAALHGRVQKDLRAHVCRERLERPHAVVLQQSSDTHLEAQLGHSRAVVGRVCAVFPQLPSHLVSHDVLAQSNRLSHSHRARDQAAPEFHALRTTLRSAY